MPGASSYETSNVLFVLFLFLGEARRGDATAAPRRACAAGINDAILRPHANFQFFVVNHVFECLIDDPVSI